MHFDITKQGDTEEIFIQGKFMHHDREAFLEIIDGFLASDASELVLDLQDTSFMDSAALGLMLLVKKTLQSSKKRFVIRNLNKRIEKMFCLMNYDKIFNIQEG